MNKKLENVAIRVSNETTATEIIAFLESNGYRNHHNFKGPNKGGVYQNVNGCIESYLNAINGAKTITFEQAKELVKPELTFPRKMLVWSTQAAKPTEKTVICKVGYNYVTCDNLLTSPNYTTLISCLVWAHAKELPTQQEINQEKIEQLQRDLVRLQAQEFTLEEQINQLKSQNCG